MKPLTAADDARPVGAGDGQGVTPGVVHADFPLCAAVILNECQIQVCSAMIEPVQRPEIADGVLATRPGCIHRPASIFNRRTMMLN